MAVQGLNRPRGRSRTLFSPLPSYPPSFFSSLCSSSGTARFRLIPLARSANPSPGIDEPMLRPAKRRYDELRSSGGRVRDVTILRLCALYFTLVRLPRSVSPLRSLQRTSRVPLTSRTTATFRFFHGLLIIREASASLIPATTFRPLFTRQKSLCQNHQYK